MDTNIIFLLFVIAVMIFVSGILSAAEMGITAASKAKLHKLASEGDKKAKIALKIREDKDTLIGAILLCFNIFSIGASMLAGRVVQELFGNDGIGFLVGTIVMTILMLIFSDVLPKTYAFYNADRVARNSAPFWQVMMRICKPVTKIIQWISDGLLKFMGLSKTNEMVKGLDALRGAIEMHHTEGNMIKDDRDMLGSILDLSEVEIDKIMVHRTDMTSISIDQGPEEIIRLAVESEHTRLPIWEGNEENIIGILNTKEVLKLDRENPSKEQIKTLLHEAVFVPENRSLRDQLRSFRKKRMHMAMVVDEYGALLGLVTLEDILEEIVGQINDEHDKALKGIKQREDGSIKVKGSLSIRDLNREMGWNISTSEDVSTLAGFVIHLAERIPEIGEKFYYQDMEFKVVRKESNQITKVRITKQATPTDE